MLPGCVAAAIPLLASGVIARKEAKGDTSTPAPNQKPIVEVLPSDNSLPQRASAAPPAAGTIAVAVSTAEPVPTELTPALQPVAPPKLGAAVTPGDLTPFAGFARFAIDHAPPLPAGKARRSALVDQDTLTSEPRLADCGDGPPAVVIDLDKGGKPFDLADPPFPATGLSEQLAAIRAAGVTVLWSASLPVDDAPKLYTVLRATGLDPDRTDRLLLLRKPDESKQTRRAAASRDWCIVALAGDRRSDFDELYDYLRDPSGPIATALEPTYGDGWFLVPPPID